MAPLVLFSFKDSPRNVKINVAAAYVGAEIIQPAFELGKDNKTPDFLKKNPFGKVPVLQTETGYIFESNAIARYVARLDRSKGLLGRNAVEEAQVDQWLDFATNEIDPSALTWLGPIFGYLPFVKEQDAKAKENITNVFKGLNNYLETRTFLVGERLTLADIVVASSLVPLYKTVLEPRFRAPHINVNRWFETVTMQEKFKGVVKLEPVQYCTVARKPQQQKKEPKAEGEKKEEKKEKEKEKPKPKDDDEEEDEDEDRKPKAKNPLDLLPKSSFDLDQFKREYSNKPIRDEVIPYLWQHFDPQGYSMWWCKYLYNEENTKLFMTTNLVSVWFQRLKMSKYAFGVMQICGPEEKHELTGFWIIRGETFPEIFSECAGTDSYEFTKIEWSTIEEHKARIAGYLTREGDSGKECLEAKVFK